MKLKPITAKKLFLGACAVISVATVLLAAIIVTGTQQQHSGWVNSRQPTSDQKNCHAYESKLISTSKIFRGSDLFTVVEPQITSTAAPLLKQTWDLRDGRGFVRFTTSRPLAEDELLAVTFGLKPHFAKLLPFLMAVFASLFSIYAYLQVQQANNILSSPRVANAIRLLPILTFGLVAWWLISHSGWTYGDDHFILASAVQGEPLPASVFPELGRFFPLGLIDVNLLVPFGNTPTAYHVERIILLGLTVVVLYLLTTQAANIAIGSLLVFVFLTTPSLLYIYGDSIFPESLLVFLLSLFFLLYVRGTRTDRGGTLIAAGVLACAATYCKEPVFGMLAVFAGTQLIFGYRHLSRKTIWLNAFLLLNGLVFLAVYFAFCSSGGNYADNMNSGTGITTWQVLLGFCGHPWFVFAALIGGVRAFCLIAGKDRSLVTFDSILFAGLSYVIAFALLRLSADYYLLPAYVCWTIAFAGYLGELVQPKTVAVAPRQPALNHRPRIFLPLAIGILALIGSFQLPDSIKSVGFVVQQRANTRALSEMFADLRDRGFDLYVYFPQEMEGYASDVQDWRCHVLNVFDSNLHGEKGVAKVLGRKPFERLHLDDQPLDSAKSLVIHDPAFSAADLNESHSGGELLDVVDNAPYVMGANLYTQTAWLNEVKESIDNHLRR